MNELLASKDSLLANERVGALGVIARNLPSNDITTTMRTVLVDWLMQVNKMLKLLPSTFFPTVNLLDAYLAREANVLKTELQLVGIAAMCLASKYNEIYAPEMSDLVFICDKGFTAQQIDAKSSEMFIKLGCCLNIPVDIDYMRIVSNDNGATHVVHSVNKALLTFLTLGGQRFLTSVVVTAAHKVCRMLYPEYDASEPYVNSFDIPSGVVDTCVSEIISLCRRSQHSTVITHYTMPNKNNGDRGLWMLAFARIGGLTPPQVAAADIAPYLRATFMIADLTIPLLPNDSGVAIRKLGEGTYGVVKQVRYDGEMYAVKKIRSELIDEGLSASYLREISILRVLDHPNIIKARFVTQNLQRIFFNLGKSDLSGWIEKHGNASHDMQLVFCQQMFGALAYMREVGCLHRDVKPQNIIVFGSNKPSGITFQLADFGLARGCQIALRGNQFTHEVVTLWYRPPEILLGGSEYDDRVDVWSMLCTLYQYATERPLFPGDSEVNQLHKIFSILGTPTEARWPDVSSLPEYDSNWTTTPRVPNTSVFYTQSISQVTQRLMIRGLIMNPAQRPDAKTIVEML